MYLEDNLRILCVMHADFEPPGVIAAWARENQFVFLLIKPYQGEACGSAPPFDILILLGGPQSAINRDATPYLEAEIALIQSAIRENKPVIGFCLGAQLIGEALGASAQKSPEKEVGIFPVYLTQAGLADPLLASLPDSFPAIHWHKDMLGLLPGAEVLAYSQGCPRQVVRYRERVYGFQCNFEMTVADMEVLIQACAEDLIPSRFTQSSTQILEHDYGLMHAILFKVLTSIVMMQKNKTFSAVEKE